MPPLWWARVTVGVVDEDGKIQELFGTVTATGMYDGEQVIFMGENCYKLNSILAVGKLPDPKPDEGEGEDVEDPDSGENVENPGEVTGPDGENSGGTESAGDQSGEAADV